MKWMIASDLHGSARYTRELLDAYRREEADRLLLLGDLLYHGPRNPLPDQYDTGEVAALLNGMADELVCVRGNCDSEVDQMVLRFPMMAEYALLPNGKQLVFATHGHHFGEAHPPRLKPGDILLCGHTHIPACVPHDGWLYLNPGSVSLPKEGSPRSYLLWEESRLTWKTLDRQPFLQRTLHGGALVPKER